MNKITIQQKDKIITLRRKGYAYESIAEKAGVSSRTAHKHGKGVKMEDDKRYGRAKRIKKQVKEETKKLLGVEQIKPSHREKFDRVISEEFDNAVKGLLQASGLATNRFVGLFGFGRSVANIVFDAEESGTYTVLPVLRNWLLGEQRLPVLPLRRKTFLMRIAYDFIFLKWDNIKKRLNMEGIKEPSLQKGWLGGGLTPARWRVKERSGLV